MTGDESDFLRMSALNEAVFYEEEERPVDDPAIAQDDLDMSRFVVPLAGRLMMGQAQHRLVAAFLAPVTSCGSPFGIIGDKAITPVSLPGDSFMLAIS